MDMLRNARDTINVLRGHVGSGFDVNKPDPTSLLIWVA